MPKGIRGFVKGDPSINRKGRLPLSFNPSDAIKAILQETDPVTRKANGIAIIHRAIQGALKGSACDRQWLFDRGYGRALEKIELAQPQLPFFTINATVPDADKPD